VTRRWRLKSGFVYSNLPPCGWLGFLFAILFIILGPSYFRFLKGGLFVNTWGRAWQGIGVMAVRFNDRWLLFFYFISPSFITTCICVGLTCGPILCAAGKQVSLWCLESVDTEWWETRHADSNFLVCSAQFCKLERACYIYMQMCKDVYNSMYTQNVISWHILSNKNLCLKR